MRSLCPVNIGNAYFSSNEFTILKESFMVVSLGIKWGPENQCLPASIPSRDDEHRIKFISDTHELTQDICRSLWSSREFTLLAGHILGVPLAELENSLHRWILKATMRSLALLQDL